MAVAVTANQGDASDGSTTEVDPAPPAAAIACAPNELAAKVPVNSPVAPERNRAPQRTATVTVTAHENIANASGTPPTNVISLYAIQVYETLYPNDKNRQIKK